MRKVLEHETHESRPWKKNRFQIRNNKNAIQKRLELLAKHTPVSERSFDSSRRCPKRTYRRDHRYQQTYRKDRFVEQVPGQELQASRRLGARIECKLHPHLTNMLRVPVSDAWISPGVNKRMRLDQIKSSSHRNETNRYQSFSF